MRYRTLHRWNTKQEYTALPASWFSNFRVGRNILVSAIVLGSFEMLPYIKNLTFNLFCVVIGRARVCGLKRSRGPRWLLLGFIKFPWKLGSVVWRFVSLRTWIRMYLLLVLLVDGVNFFFAITCVTLIVGKCQGLVKCKEFTQSPLKYVWSVLKGWIHLKGNRKRSRMYNFRLHEFFTQ